MKRLSTAVAGLAVVIVSETTMAECPKIDKSTLIDATTTINSTNAAIGKNASANTGAINIKGTEIKESSVINQTTSKSLNMSNGKGSSANSGSIDLQ